MTRTDSDRVDVWHIDLDTAVKKAAVSLRSVLSEEERARSARIGDPVSRARFAAARGATRLIIGRCLGRSPAGLTWRTGRWGKPRVTGHEDALRFSLSHCAGRAVVAVTGPRDVGVDLERSRESRDVVALSRRYFPADESALVAEAAEGDRPAVFLTLWTRKEACTKAAGTSLLRHGLRLSVTATREADGAVLAHDPSRQLPGSWTVHDIPAPPGHGAAVAVDGDAPVHLTIRPWEPQ
ncbi:4'-phosphopantetheinyl transferase superfamily protein [Streptomyces arenae]|nr:4'-phosphopantetheinyl transferase superfamily protein [Streptomyces arenae]